MVSVSEALAQGAKKNEAIVCPYSQSEKHSNACVCRGSGKVKVCADCQGAGWNATLNHACRSCGGAGCFKA